MMRFQFRSVHAVDGKVAVHVTAFLPLGITKEIHVHLSPEDADKLIVRARVALDEIRAAGMRRLT